MRDSLGNVIPAMTNPSPGAIRALQAPGAALRAAAGPQLKMAGPPTNASPAAQQALDAAAIRQTNGTPAVPRMAARGLGSAIRSL